MRTLAVVGTFDTHGGKPSKIGGQIAQALGWPHINGGHISLLQPEFTDDNRGSAANNPIDPLLYDAMLWMPWIDNNETKMLPRLKARNRKLILISSKRCGDKYTDADVVGRLLKSKSNLGIAIKDPPDAVSPDHRFLFDLLDPLGNIYASTPNTAALAGSIADRVGELATMSRCQSQSCGPRTSLEMDKEFLATVRHYGNKFAEFVNAINPNRYLGNAATRCSYGFPAERRSDTILVSRRNVPKGNITADDFVEVMKQENMIFYRGDQKPSVDAPIQIMLFKYFRQVRYMIHGHVYVKGAQITTERYPCGAMQEFFAITQMADKNTEGFAVNLRGHGCIIACKRLGYFDTVELFARPFPEW